MKKWMLGLVMILIIATGSVYIFIPSGQSVSYTVSISYLQAGIEKIFLDKNKIQKWWPGKVEQKDLYSYKGYNYRVQRVMLSGINFSIVNGRDSIAGILKTVPATGNKTLLQWESPVSFSINPLKRLQQYFSYVDYKKNIEAVLNEAKVFFEKEENIYGVKVNKLTVTDTTMVSLKQSFDHYPSTQEIYVLINSLKTFVTSQGVEENNFPMVNVHNEDTLKYDLMVALPTKKDIKTEPPFLLKKMIPGNILMAEVKGGVSVVKEAEQALSNYISDYQMTSPAMPFQLLVTNRLLENDTSKWITKIYFPVF